MKKFKILFLIDKLVPAGTQANLLEIVKRLDRNRFEPRVIALLGGGELVPEFEAAGIKPMILKVGKAYGPSGWKALFFLIRYMKKEAVDIVQTHFLHADILGALAAKLARVPAVVTSRRDEGYWRGKRQLGLNRYFSRFADKILVNSDAVQEAAMRSEALSSKKVHRIYNGVDPVKFAPSEKLRSKMRETLGFRKDEFVIGMVANMRHEVKGHRFLIKAVSMVHKEIPKVRLLLIGDGPLKSNFERYGARYDVLDRITFLGARRDIPALVNAMDLVCVPSLSEGFSNTLLESMAVGRPVVATNVGGNPEVICENETGLLVRPRHAEALAGKILVLLRNEKLRNEMGTAGRKRIEAEFTIDKMVKEYEEFYEHLIKGDRQVSQARESVGQPPERRRHRSRIRVMHMIWSLDLGGTEQAVCDLVRRLNRNTFHSVVCCLNDKGRFADRVEREGIRVIAMHKRPKFDPNLLPRLVRVIKREKIRLIHTHLFTANLWGRLAAKLTGVPVISSEHGMDTWRTSLHWTLDRWLTPVSKRIVFVSDGVKQFYGERNPSLNGKSRVIHNGIDVALFQGSFDRLAIRKSLGIGARQKVVGIVGRLVPEKAHVDFLEAIQLLREKRKDVTALIVGEGKLLGALQKRIREAKLQEHVIFTGFRADLPELYQAMDVLVLCSLREGFPLAILEAMAAGVPVVATEVGGVKEMLEHGKDSLLVLPGDSLALSGAIAKLMSSRELRENLRSRAKEKVRSRFSVERMVQNYESLYLEVLSS